jgi:hypothetical protein
MNGLAHSVQWLWAISIVAQVVVFVLLLLNGNFRKLPILTTYIALNLAQAAFLYFLYARFGLSSRVTATFGWASEATTLFAQALAATETLHLVLGPFRGIWGLGWRTLAATSTIIFVYVAVHTHGDVSWALLEADRGYHLIFATALIACLLLVRYYSVPIPPPYKALLGGFCFFSCAMILINTVFQSILYRGVASYQPVWQFSTVLSFVFVQVMWMVGLRKPLPVEDRQIATASDSAYQRLSPEINIQLRLLNEKLMRLWKLEVRSQ